ncbi:uncharacterized protein [Aegilops tauschii subsp. strangulata]|uniref:uncharacterized protein n=1 Tax=Aegilops tauschii subsp. strangulata TaxID=200361 RepID=UPI00098BA8A3|nr:zinc finger protein CONSTANS-LIKE 15-like [Aegilops tauschii subsp. strangulata]
MLLCTCASRLRCALCGAGADVHCQADAAFLCAPCDAKVHGANFLASRHRRTRVQPPNHVRVLCRAALQLWARQMGLDARAARLCAAAAGRTLLLEFTAAPPQMLLRVAMAAALWSEVAAHGGVHKPRHALKRLEACARVPASSLVVVATAIGRARLVRTAGVDAKEDSVECLIVSPRKTPQELCLFV